MKDGEDLSQVFLPGQDLQIKNIDRTVKKHIAKQTCICYTIFIKDVNIHVNTTKDPGVGSLGLSFLGWSSFLIIAVQPLADNVCDHTCHDSDH